MAAAPPSIISPLQQKQQTENEKKGYPGASSDGVFQYNQPLMWFNTTTHELVGRFLNTSGLDMFFPPSFEYELASYIFNCADHTITHAYSSVANFNTARLVHLVATSKNKPLDKLFVDRLNHVTGKWEEARLEWVANMAKLRDTLNVEKRENGNGNEEEEEGNVVDEEKIRMCCVESCMSFGELTIRLVVAALYMTFVARLHLTNFVHDNHVLIKLQDLFSNDSDDLNLWYDTFVQQLFDQKLSNANVLLQIGGKLKKDEFVAEYLASDDEKKRTELINKHGALTHEDYYLGDFLMDLVFFVWKQYQTCFVDDGMMDTPQDGEAGQDVVENSSKQINQNSNERLIPHAAVVHLHNLVHYSRAAAENTPESVTNEKNIISFLNQINKKQ